MATDNLIKITIKVFKDQAQKAVEDVNKGFLNFQKQLDNVRVTVQGFKEAVSVIQGTFGQMVSAANEVVRSNMKLEAASKLTGESLETLKSVSSSVQEQFQLTQQQANEFTIVLTKLGQKAGDTSKTADAIRRLLDLAAAQGLSAEEALTAINQALLGIDEGTDKLFQKNPSQIYQEYAESIGTTAGKLTDQQKAQALLNEVMEKGLKVQGSYKQLLESGLGAQQQFEKAMQETKATLGSIVSEILTPVLRILKEVLDIFKKMPKFVQGMTLAVIGLASAMSFLNIALGPVSLALTGIAAITVGLVAQFSDTGKSTEALAKKMKASGDFIKNYSEAIDEAGEKLTEFKNTIESLSEDEVKNAGKDILYNIRSEVNELTKYIFEVIPAFVDGYKRDLESQRVLLKVLNIGQEIERNKHDFSRLREVVKNGIDEINNILKNEKLDAVIRKNIEAILSGLKSGGFANLVEMENLFQKFEALQERANKKRQSSAKISLLELEFEKEKLSLVDDEVEKINRKYDIEKNILLLKLEEAKAAEKGEEVKLIEEEISMLNKKKELELELLQRKADAGLMQQIRGYSQQEQMLLLQIEQERALATARTEEERYRIMQFYALKRLNLEEQYAIEAIKKQYKYASPEKLEEAKLKIHEIYEKKREEISIQTERNITEARKREFEKQEQYWQEYLRVYTSSFEYGMNLIIRSDMTGAEKRREIWRYFYSNLWRYISRTVTMSIFGEEAKTAAVLKGVGIRMAAIAKEVFATLRSAAASIAKAAAAAVEWLVSTLGPFGMAASAAAVAGIFAFWGNIKNALGFAKGGIVRDETYAVIGEAGDSEAVIPLNAQGAAFMAELIPKIIMFPAELIESIKNLNSSMKAISPKMEEKILSSEKYFSEKLLLTAPNNIRQPEVNFDAFRNDLVKAIQNIKLEIRAELDALQFYRKTFPQYEADIRNRRIK